MRRTHMLVITALACLLTTGCPHTGPGATHGGVGGPEAAPPPPPPELLTLLPPDTFAVLRADLVQVRESPYYELVVGLITTLVDAEQDMPVDVIDILSRSDEIVVGMTWPVGEHRADFYLLLRGRFGPGELESVLRSIEQHGAAQAAAGEGQHTPLVTLDHQGHQVFAVEDLAFTALGQHTWIVAEPDLVALPIARATGADTGPGPRASESFEALAELVAFDQAPVALVLEATEGLRAELLADMQLDQSGGSRMLIAIIEALVGGAARADLSQGIRVEGFVETTNALVASAAADIIEESLITLTDGEALRDLVGTPQVRVEGTRALITLAAPDEQVRRLLGSIEAIEDLVEAIDDTPATEPVAPDQEQLEQPLEAEPPAPQSR